MKNYTSFNNGFKANSLDIATQEIAVEAVIASIESEARKQFSKNAVEAFGEASEHPAIALAIHDSTRDLFDSQCESLNEYVVNHLDDLIVVDDELEFHINKAEVISVASEYASVDEDWVQRLYENEVQEVVESKLDFELGVGGAIVLKQSERYTHAWETADFGTGVSVGDKAESLASVEESAERILDALDIEGYKKEFVDEVLEKVQEILNSRGLQKADPEVWLEHANIEFDQPVEQIAENWADYIESRW